jgi:hypothetical protein
MMRYHSELETHVVLKDLERYQEVSIESVRNPILQVCVFFVVFLVHIQFLKIDWE